MNIKPNGQVIPTQWTTTDGPSNLAIQNMHESNLACAKIALHKVPTNQRHFGSLTIAGNHVQLENAKKLISEFYASLELQFSVGPKNSIIQISTQIFPINFGDSLENA